MFIVDAVLHTDFQAAAASDDLAQTVNYAAVHKYECTHDGRTLTACRTEFGNHRTTDLALPSGFARTIREVVEGSPQQLIEAVAEQTAAAVLHDHAAVVGIDVLVKKPQAPIDGTFHYVGVSLSACWCCPSCSQTTLPIPDHFVLCAGVRVCRTRADVMRARCLWQ